MTGAESECAEVVAGRATRSELVQRGGLARVDLGAPVRTPEAEPEASPRATSMSPLHLLTHAFRWVRAVADEEMQLAAGADDAIDDMMRPPPRGFARAGLRSPGR